MANVRDSDTSLWLHNKLGTSNDSWISGSICSQLNKEVLHNIKECFPDLQTQVKLKLLLNLFHIPRRLVEEWKTELDEIIEVACLDSELWVSMLAETMKTFPASGSLNTEISDYDDTRPIFTDMVSDLRKLVNKHCDLGMLPLECQYLNKNALISVVGQQPNTEKHFIIKRKPKSSNLRAELLHKSEDAQSSLKKTSAPTIPLRSRGMPRKMTDTTPLKGIPSRVPTSGFRSANITPNQQRPNLSRTQAGRKDGGIKLIELADQPLGYAAAKKRKREQQLEEQAKKQEQKQSAAAAAAAAAASTNANNVNSDETSPNSTPTTPITKSVNMDNGTPTHAEMDVTFTPTTPTTVHANLDIKCEPLSTPTKVESICMDESIKTNNSASENNSLPTTPTTVQQQIKQTDVTPTTTKRKSRSASTRAQKQQQNVNNNNNNSNINNNNNNAVGKTPNKRVKQEIEIKSEEILIPANTNIQLEQHQQNSIHVPIATQTVTLTAAQAQSLVQQVNLQQQQQQQQQRTPPRLQQRIQQTREIAPKQLIIRTTGTQQQQQQGKQTQIIGGVTLTSQKLQQQQQQQSPTKLDTKQILRTVGGTVLTTQQLRQAATNPLANLPNNISVKITSSKTGNKQTIIQPQPQQQSQQQTIFINNTTPKQQISNINTQTTTTTTAQTLKSMPLSQLKSATSSGPVIISQTIIQPAKRTILPQQQIIQRQTIQQPQQQYLIATSQSNLQTQQQVLPTLTSFANNRSGIQQATLYQTANTIGGNNNTQTGGTKILLKTSPTSSVMVTPVRQTTLNMGNNPPPLIATNAINNQQQSTSNSTTTTMLNLQNVQLPNRPVTIQPASQAAQQQHMQAQLQQQHPQHTLVPNNAATQQPKLTQVLVQSNPTIGVTGGINNSGQTVGNITNTNLNKKTIILTQKGMILRNIGGDMYQQIPISNVSNIQTLGQGATIMTTASGPPSLVKTSSANIQQQQQHLQTQTIQIQPQQNKQTLPTLLPTNSIGNAQTHMIVQQQPTQTTGILSNNSSQQTIIRPLMGNVSSGITTLPQGLTLITRPGQQPQLLQVSNSSSGLQQQQQQRAIITTSQQQSTQQPQLQTRQIILTQKPTNVGVQQQQQQQRLITNTTQLTQNSGSQTISRPAQIVHVQQQQQQQQQQNVQQPQRKGLSLSNEHVHKAHEMFRKANRVSRPDKALILGFMAGLRENPRPNSENVIIIKLDETEEKIQQDDGSTAHCLVESIIRLDYNTGEWKTFKNYRRKDQNVGGSGNAGNSGNVDNSGLMQTQQSSVAI